MLTLMCQRDPRWKDLKIGNSNATIGKFGCLITCIAMLSSYFGHEHTPDELAKIFSFTDDGRVIWRSVVLEHFCFAARIYTRNDEQIRRALKDPDKAVIFEIGGGTHWVLGISKGIAPNQYRIADPWLGDRTTIMRYGNNITGAAFFERI